MTTDPDHRKSREYPAHPIPSVHTAVFRGNQVLVIQRATEPSKGRWSLPGGGIELGEKLHEAAKREVWEECGVEFTVAGLIDMVDNIVLDEGGKIRFHYLVIYLLGRYLSGIPTAHSDAADMAWISREEIPKLDMNPVAMQVLLKAFELVAGGTGQG